MIELPNGRVLEVGSRWVSNDPRRYRIVKVMELDNHCQDARVANIVTGECSWIAYKNFKIGLRGWSRI